MVARRDRSAVTKASGNGSASVARLHSNSVTCCGSNVARSSEGATAVKFGATAAAVVIVKFGATAVVVEVIKFGATAVEV
jgi:hypothetical protein